MKSPRNSVNRQLSKANAECFDTNSLRWRFALVVFVAFAFVATSCSAFGLADDSTDDALVDDNAVDGILDDDAQETPSSEVTPEPTTPAPTPALVYVSAAGDRAVNVLRLGVDGSLTPLDQSVELEAAAGAMVYSASTRRLYVGAGNAISTIALDDAGTPTLLGTTPVDGEPVYLDLLAADQVLAVAFFGEDEIRTYSLAGEPNGYLLQQADPLEVEPHAIVVSPDGTRAYAPHRNGNFVGVYAVDAAGNLERFGGVSAEPGLGPRHLALSPDGSNAYVINESGDSVSVYGLNAEGALAPAKQTISTLPAGIDPGSNTGADIHVSRDGAFVYASNRGDDSIAVFQVGAAGELSSLGHVATQERPREFDISPDGRYLIAAGQDSGQLETYAIGQDGLLTSLGVTPAGASPVWVTIVAG